jgi:hypothetical protein
MAADKDKSIASEFDQHHLSLVSEEQEEGWQAKICRYLKDLPADVMKDTDVIAWWQVRVSRCSYLPSLLIIFRITDLFSQPFSTLP